MRPTAARRGTARRASSGVASLLVVTLAGASVLPAGVAHAYHDAHEHIQDDTAWTLEGDKSWRLGFFRLDYTLFDRVTVGTYHWIWLFRVANLNLKWRLYGGDRWQWAVRGGFFRLDTAVFDPDAESAPIFTLGSFELSSSVALFPRHQLSQSFVYTAVNAKGRLEDGELSGLAEVGATNLQYVAAYEIRVSRQLALVFTGRYLLAQLLSGQSDLAYYPDDFTTVEVVGSALADEVDFRNAFSVTGALAWSWESFNLRLGMGYGNFNVPGINFTLEQRGFFPELDMYWTF